MSKKKSYMKTSSVLSEGFIDSLVRLFVPKSVQAKVSDKYLKIKQAELEKVQKNLERLGREEKATQEKLFKALEKQYNVKIPRKKARKEYEKHKNQG